MAAWDGEVLADTRRELHHPPNALGRIALMPLADVENTVAHDAAYLRYANDLKEKYERACTSSLALCHRSARTSFEARPIARAMIAR